MQKTPIEWTDYSWSPVIGCSRISPGCGGKAGEGGCYAERLVATRMSKNPKLPMYHGLARLNERGEPRWTGEVRFLPERLAEPLRLRKGHRIFPCDMSDLFHEAVTNEQIAAVFGVMAACPQHVFQVLTKRAERLLKWFAWLERECSGPGGQPRTLRCGVEAMNRGADVDYLGLPDVWPLPNVHLGVSVEDRKHGLPRIEDLRRTPAALRWLSIEPLLEDLGDIDLTGIGWVVLGGESGPGARPFDLAWARSIRDQCKGAGVSFFFKQAGRNVIDDSSGYMPDGRLVVHNYRDKKGGDLAELPADLRIREMPAVGGALPSA